MTFKFTNNASSTLAAGINTSVASLTVLSGAGSKFPAITGVSAYYCTLSSGAAVEVVLVTARSTDTFTIVRGQDGTTGQSWSSDAAFELRVTAAEMTSLQTAPQSVASITALKALSKLDRPWVAVAGYTTSGDGGGGLYWLDTADTTSLDNGGTIIVGTDGGRWKLALTGPLSVMQFGAVGDSTTDNTAAFAAIEALVNPARVYVPEGKFLVTWIGNLLKTYFGPGTIKDSLGNWVPGTFTWVATKPSAPDTGGLPYYFEGDLSKTEAEYYTLGYTLGSTIRTSFTEPYFRSQTTPHFEWFDNYAGSSGTICRISASATLGQPSITVNSSAGVSGGVTLTLANSAGTVTDTLVVASIGVGTITFTSNLTHSYVAGNLVSPGNRTMCPQHHQEVIHRGGGDSYATVYRISNSYAPTAGQDHFYFTSTAGAIGGDLSASSSGNYFTGLEWQFIDNGYDVAVIGDVYSYNRTNNTGARFAIWVGELHKSEGTVPGDALYIGRGAWRMGLDVAQGDFSSNGQCAISLGVNHRIYFGNSMSAGTNPYPILTNNLSTTYMGFDGSSLQIVAGANQAAYFDSTGATFTKSFNVPSSGNISASATAGGATLPAAPFTFLIIKIDGTNYKIPVYNS